ncbi:MAG: hypothetical protein K9K67_00735 [Bacteriovoracaceae bacterium]|nr:hypothetical protein [Bacteriovoracaceae bacterium]
MFSFTRLPKRLSNESILAFFILALVGSPSLSLVKYIGGGVYFPNEKLVFLFLIFKGLRHDGLDFLRNKSLVPFMGLSLIFSFFILARALFWKQPHFRDLNIALTIFSVGLIYHFFSENKGVVKKAIKWNLWLQTLVGIFQLVNVYFGNKELAMIFHNHPMQEGYYFHWRVSGLFMESSQYASFLAIGIFSELKQERLKALDYLLLMLALIVFICNRALTGYLIFILWMLIDNKKSRLMLLFSLFLLVVDFFTVGFAKIFLLSSFNKIFITFFDFTQISGEVRFINALNAIKEWYGGWGSFLMGVENRQIDQIGDVFSYNLYRFGLIGFIFIVGYYHQLIKTISKKWLLILPLFVTCGPIAQPIQIIYLIFLRLGICSKKSS